MIGAKVTLAKVVWSHWMEFSGQQSHLQNKLVKLF